jgi:hypothetical protein
MTTIFSKAKETWQSQESSTKLKLMKTAEQLFLKRKP